MLFSRDKSRLPSPEEAFPGGARWFAIAEKHRVVDAPVVTDDVPGNREVAVFRLGCLGVEEIADFPGAPQFPPPAGRELPRRHSTADRQRTAAPPVRP
jgi:hypothetical protein